MKKILIIAFVVTITLANSFGQNKLGTKGKYVAFLVGANNYVEFDKLNYPLQDIIALKETLKEYSFAEENIIFADNPTEDKFLLKTEELKRKAKKVIIYWYIFPCTGY